MGNRVPGNRHPVAIDSCFALFVRHNTWCIALYASIHGILRHELTTPSRNVSSFCGCSRSRCGRGRGSGCGCRFFPREPIAALIFCAYWCSTCNLCKICFGLASIHPAAVRLCTFSAADLITARPCNPHKCLRLALFTGLIEAAQA